MEAVEGKRGREQGGKEDKWLGGKGEARGGS